MITTLLLLLFVQTPPPTAATQTPLDCMKSARDFSSRRMKELSAGSQTLTGDIVRQAHSERAAMLKECGAKFDLAKTPASELAALVEFYVESQQLDLARQALAKGLADTTLAAAVRANLLVLAVRTTLQLPKSAERNAAAEDYVRQLDALDDSTLEQKLTAHGALNGYYRGDDIDDGIIRHSTWMIEAGKRLTPAQRRQFANSIVSAYVNLAEAVAGHGENDRALDLLKRASAEWPESSYGAARVKDVLARYSLVGSAAPAISAPMWLNRSSSEPLGLTGKVTLVQFTAHWCGPCKESYPGMKRLLERFAKDNFQIVFYTRTYGYFEQERNLTPEQEIERDKKYYAGYGFTLPIAVGPPTSTMVDGKRQAHKDPVEDAYAVGGIPQINIIDKTGRVRLVMIGYDDANEEKLASFIQRLLKETND